MPQHFKDKEHLVRVALLFLGGAFIFMVVRGLLVPRDFGVYGHFRANSLQEISSHPLAYAGRAACEDCHSDVFELRKGSKHEMIGCEACHGPLAAHAADPEAVKPTKPDPKTICLVCHLKNVAKPKGFPQVDPKEHADGEACTTCHQHHHPENPPEGSTAQTQPEVK